jgi:Fe-S cluster biosynthesis and repair protein YggX
MWANTCWGLFGIGFALALAMIGLPPEYTWLQPWFLRGAALSLTASILCFSWPLWMRLARRFAKWSRSRGEAQPYLSDVDAELGSAIRDMATYSAWAKWFASQSLATNNHQHVSQSHLMHMASFIVLDALMNGKLLARGRPSGAIEYEDISREAWRLVGIRMEPHLATLWHSVLFPRSGVSPARIEKLLSYDSIIVDSREFQALWPRSDKPTDKARMRLLKKAKKEGADPEHIEKLSKGSMATWP